MMAGRDGLMVAVVLLSLTLDGAGEVEDVVAVV